MNIWTILKRKEHWMPDKKPIDKNDRIQKRLVSDSIDIEDRGYTVVGTFLQGSQNYGLDTEESDIDTKVIIVPSFNDVVLNKKPVSTTAILPSDEHIDVKDIRCYFDCIKKQNINFLEVLFTDYKFIKPEFKEAFQPMLDNNEKIAHYNIYKAISTMVGMVREKRKQLTHSFPARMHMIEKYGYDPKQLHHILRVGNFLSYYIEKVPYKQCLFPLSRDYLIKVKTRPPYSLQEAQELADLMLESVLEMQAKYYATHEPYVDKEVEEIMNNVLCDIFKISFRKDILQ